MGYMIESEGPRGRDWSEEYVGRDIQANTFASIAEAEAVIDSLRALGEEWATAKYRVVERK